MDKRLIWLAVGSFTIGTESFVMSSLLPAISADARISLPQAGYLITAFALAYAIGAPVLTTFAGSADRRRVIAVTMALFVAGNLLAAASSSFALLLIARIMMALAAGLFAATAQATAVALAGPEHRARAISIIVGGTTVAVALGAPLGALIGAALGWRGTFLSVAALAAVAAVILWIKLPDGLRGTRLALSARLTAAVQPGIFPSLVTTFLCMTGAFIVFSYIAPLATEGAGLSAAALPGMLLAFGVGAAAGNLSSGYLADRFGAAQTVFVVLGLLAVALAMFSVIPLFVPHPAAGWLLVAAMIPWGLIGWAFPPAQASHIVGVSPELAPITLSLNNSALYLGVAFGSFVGGLVLKYGTVAELGYAAALFEMLAMFSLVVFQKPAAQAAARAAA
ncbi:MFS transporter [Brucella endophytica]|uniref:MFS transporter n=1 Tax=Brucella endophytica TaxID=1963359 RepID=A0A916WGC3_9HYPH|nr:MFS transporter [Brucella endophytica]GGA96703.1 MFS transporter [Brucella endophytica]